MRAAAAVILNRQLQVRAVLAAAAQAALAVILEALVLVEPLTLAAAVVVLIMAFLQAQVVLALSSLNM
jgi:flagellar biosynthesis protein FliP